MAYARLTGMVVVSTAVMYILMYLNTYALDHVWFSQTRLWMALIMGAAMAPIMLLFMRDMYTDQRANLAVFGVSALVLIASVWLVRSQALVDDLAYMEAMIPHHSIAILTSTQAHIRDPRVRDLADGIIEAQVREIGEMETLIAALRAQPVPAGSPDLPPRPAD